MKIGFDLDGTLDRPAVAELASVLLAAGHEVHIITGVFPEAVDWQDAAAKRQKLRRLGIDFYEGSRMNDSMAVCAGQAILHILDAVPATFARDYRLADLGLRKGALCEELGITMFFDDSQLYCEMIPKMSGNTVVLQVRPS
jgi:hypothetical protein